MTIELDGTPMWRPLPDTQSPAVWPNRQFTENLATCHTSPDEAISSDITTITKRCLAIGGAVIAGQDVSDELNRLSAAAAGWARDGVPIDIILHAVHEGLRLSLDLASAPDSAYGRDTVLDGLRSVMSVSNLLSTTITRAYLREYRGVVGEHHTAAHTLTAALLAGRATATMARECGISIASTYRVIAVSIPQPCDRSLPQYSGRHEPRTDTTIMARRTLRRVRTALAEHSDDALAMLSISGGTVLIPGEHTDDTRLDILIAALSSAARFDLQATVVSARAEEIPAATQQAHELLSLVRNLGYAARLYRFGDLAVEYQLTRPGPGLAQLGELLTPLDTHPDLYKTLQVHIANNMNRQRTARILHVHTNTVIYRLRRIATLTGLDPTQAASLWQLKSAMIARSFHPEQRSFDPAPTAFW